jgi:hypothetical protein
VAFVSEWWEASKALGLSTPVQSDLQQRAHAWLAEASERVAAYPLPELRPDLPGVWRRVFLVYPLQSPGARVARGAFYLLIGWTPIVLGVAASNWLFVPVYARFALVIAVGAVVVGALLRALAVAVERHESRRAAVDGPEQGWFRTAFLVHRLEAPAARRGRLAMHVLLVAMPADLVNYLVLVHQQPSARQLLPLTVGGLLALAAAVMGMRTWTLSLERRGRSGKTIVGATLTDPPTDAQVVTR